MQIGSVMTRCPYKINAASQLSEALKLMELNNVRHLPVVNEQGVVLGVIGERELRMSQVVCDVTKYCPSVGDILTGEPFVAKEGDTLESVAAEMISRRTDYALVIDAEENITGIFTTTDALKVMRLLIPGGAK